MIFGATTRKMLRKVEWRLLPRKKPQGLILLYHRVTELENDPWNLCVSPTNFAAHLSVLRQLGVCRTVRDLPSALMERNDSPLFSVTFDDGYSDNATTAAPFLVDRRIPGTFFVVSRSVGSDREFWWDALDRILLKPGVLPPALKLTVAGRKHCWDLGDARRYSLAEFHRDKRWRADDEPVHSRRQAVFLELWHILVGVPRGERLEAIDRMYQWAQMDPHARRSYSALSREQLVELASSDLIEIGAHTRTHPSLPHLPREAQEEEITGSKKELESIIGRPVVSFSYPYGRYASTAEDAVREAGFVAAVTSKAQALLRDSRPLALPRIQVKDWPPQSFRQVVTSYL